MVVGPRGPQFLNAGLNHDIELKMVSPNQRMFQCIQKKGKSLHLMFFYQYVKNTYKPLSCIVLLGNFGHFAVQLVIQV